LKESKPIKKARVTTLFKSRMGLPWKVYRASLVFELQKNFGAGFARDCKSIHAVQGAVD
jgi:hypothetical protein